MTASVTAFPASRVVRSIPRPDEPISIIPNLSAANLRQLVERATRLARSMDPTCAAMGLRNLRDFRDHSEFMTIRIYAGMALAAIQDSSEGEV